MSFVDFDQVLLITNVTSVVVSLFTLAVSALVLCLYTGVILVQKSMDYHAHYVTEKIREAQKVKKVKSAPVEEYGEAEDARYDDEDDDF